ncbi:MAG TPA: glycosyltransferase family 87 protein [Acidobacteriaceae bacterium]
MATVRTAENAVRIESERKFALNGWRGVALVLLAVCCSFWQLHVHNRVMGPNYSDLVTRWVGTRAAIAGLDPYSEDMLPDMLRMYYGHYPLTPSDPNPERQRFDYPANLVVLLAPLAYFNWRMARVIYLVVTIALLVLGLRGVIEMYPRRWTRLQIALALALAVCSWPVLWGLRLQQPTLLVAGFMFLACFCLSRGRERAAGILLALATVKPQIAVVLLAWILWWAVLHRAWRLLASFGTTLAVMLLLTEAVVPHWISRWRASLAGYGSATDTASALENLFGHWAGLAFTVLIAGFLCLNLWRLRRVSADSPEFPVAVGMAFALTVLVIPTHLTMIYNQVLLFPACLFVVQAKPADRDSRIVRWVVLAFLCVTFTLPLASVIGETISRPSAFWDALPYFCNSPLIGAVAMAAAILATRGQKPTRQLLKAE